MLFVQGSSFIHLGFKELTETLNKNLIKMSEEWKVVKQLQTRFIVKRKPEFFVIILSPSDFTGIINWKCHNFVIYKYQFASLMIKTEKKNQKYTFDVIFNKI